MRYNLKPEQMRKGDVLIETGQTVARVRYTNSLGTAFEFTTGLGLLLSAKTGYEIERPAVPGAVAVDTYCGYVFAQDEKGRSFTPESAASFAEERNAGLKVPTYQVFLLTPVEA